jgi:hypothetical protein
MTPERIADLKYDLWQYVFAMLDAEPEIDGYEAGRIAAAVERAFESVITESEQAP